MLYLSTLSMGQEAYRLFAKNKANKTIIFFFIFFYS